MKLLPVIIGVVVVGGGIAAAIALSHPARPKLQIRQDAGGYYWVFVESDGSVAAETSLRFATESAARASAQEAMAS